MTDSDNRMVRMLALIFPVVFNVLFFVLPVKKSMFTWVCYAFIHLAYFLLVYAIFYMGASRKQYQNRTTIISLTGIYFMAELVVGGALIVLQSLLFIINLRPWHAILIQGLMFAVFFAIALSLLLANRHDEQTDTIRALETLFIKGSSESVKAMMEKGPTPKANKAIEQVYDKLRTSPVASTPEAQQVETQIRSRINALNGMKTEEDILETTSEILDLIDTRNSVLRMGN